jgi:histone acetyltransferase (RNA polymerase elongator complex component)
MSKKHSNISIFVPHIGCPNKCSFCNQRYITGTSSAPNAADVEKAVITAVKSKKYDPSTTEIAFFGGSFTAIDLVQQTKLLKAAYSYVEAGKVNGIRCSTRPDCITEEILENYINYGGVAIELGVQSTDKDVLKKSRRGHSFEDVVNAAQLIKAKGLELGVQMMLGLPGDTFEKMIKTLEESGRVEGEGYDAITYSDHKTISIYKTVAIDYGAEEVIEFNFEYDLDGNLKEIW